MRGGPPTATRGSSLPETRRGGGYKHLFQGIACTGTAPGGGKKSGWGQIQAPGEGGRGQSRAPGAGGLAGEGSPPSETPAHLPAPGSRPVRPGRNSQRPQP